MPDIRTLYNQMRVMGVPRGEALNGNGQPSEPDDPIAAAVLRQRAAAASRIDDGTTRLLETQAELERRKVEVEARQLELQEMQTEAKLHTIRAELAKIATNNEGRSQGDVGLQALLQFMQQGHETAKSDRETLFSLLNEQLEASRARQDQAAKPAESTSVAEQIQQLVQIRAAMAELFPPVPPAPGVNAHQALEMRKLELDLEFQRARLAEESQARTIKLQQDERRMLAEIGIRDQQLKAETERNQRMAGLIEQLGPAALAALSQRFTGDSPPPAPPPPAAGGQELQNMRQGQCPVCGGIFFIEPNAEAIVCPHCHAYHDLRTSAAAAG